MAEVEKKLDSDLNLGIKEINSSLKNTLIDSATTEVTAENLAKADAHKEEGNKAFKGFLNLLLMFSRILKHLVHLY